MAMALRKDHFQQRHDSPASFIEREGEIIKPSSEFLRNKMNLQPVCNLKGKEL